MGYSVKEVYKPKRRAFLLLCEECGFDMKYLGEMYPAGTCKSCGLFKVLLKYENPPDSGSEPVSH